MGFVAKPVLKCFSVKWHDSWSCGYGQIIKCREKGEGRRGHGGWRNEGQPKLPKGLRLLHFFVDFHIKTHSPWGFKVRTFSIFPNHHGNVSHGQTVSG